MMMSFLAQLTESRGAAHLYRIIMDGGERFAFLVLDVDSREIFSSNVEGDPVGDLRLSLEDGSLCPASAVGDTGEEETSEMSREEFALVSGSVARAWRKEGEPPARITKFYG
ncbi:hypothetical protein RM844_24475 [Streptomyces sp. DSM 44915]|uniref:Uncharacterized protein n=1 Tax=Streptomyces chisholmiae TaxID=3075540 RepID=A0ABU2JWR2_9ACTN|nr:hypothetical protein [Streptomyces sp. DSM 44915]MDT0269442.1 hypothetical protein [Streptomyces sp. DSM 44915]